MTNKTRKGRPKGSSKEETLRQIVPVARRLFAEKGFAQTTFKDIGAALGLSHAALYTYFDNKKALYLATLAETQQFLLPHYRTAFEMDAHVKDKLCFIFSKMAEAHDEDESITGFLASVPIEMRRHQELIPDLASSHDPVLTLLNDIFDQAKARGELSKTLENGRLMTALFGGSIGVALYHYGTFQEGLALSMAVFNSLLEGVLFS